MLGLRTQEGEKFEHFFDLVQKTAAKENKVFFLDFSEGNEIETDYMIVDDMCGWLVPVEGADLFEQMFMGKRSLDKWSEYITWVLVNHDTLDITFKQY